MSSDNRYQLNDCEANTGWAGDDTATPISTTGSFIEGSAGLSTQLSNGDEHMYTTEDSTATGTFNIDMSDVTIYANVKDNLGGSFANGGIQIVIGDGTNRIGYDVAGNDARGMPQQLFFTAFKLDVSVIVASPGSSAAYAGSETSMDQTGVTEIGYGSNHLAKAVGSVDNVIMDGFYYIANGSYALTINGGTSGTPETMADVVGDDESGGWGLVTNPAGSLYWFFGPTEWGESSANADHYFTADSEQWFWIGDNAGGHQIGSGNFPFRLVSNSTDTGSWVVSNTAIVNTGARAEFDMSDSNFDTIEMDGCSLTGLSTVSLPTAGGTSRFTTNNIFSNCDAITNNGADMDGCSILGSIVAADTGALVYDVASDPDGTLDNLTIEKGSNSHHAIDFGTNVDSSLTSITLRGINFNGFGSSDDSNDSTVRFLATSGTLTLNLIDCLVDGATPVASGGGQNFSVDDAAGMTVTVVIQPVTLKITVRDKNTLALIDNAQTSIHLKDSPFTELMNEDTVSGVASESYAGSTPVDVVYRVRKSDDLDSPRYKAASGITQITSSGLDITVLLEQNPVLN